VSKPKANILTAGLSNDRVTVESLLAEEHEAAKMLHVSVKTLQRKRKAGSIPFVRIGTRVLYSVDTLRTWIAEQERVEVPAS